MSKIRIFRLLIILTSGMALFGAEACSRISVSPRCPEQIEVGQSGQLDAQEVDPGAIPTYLWSADPAAAVDIADPGNAETTFEALAEGQVTFTLTASDGLFQVIDTCTTQITAPAPIVAVSLVAAPTTVEQGGSTLLTCTSTGTLPVATFQIDQLDGALAELTIALPGTAVAEFDALGPAVFRCIGLDAEARRSEPALVTVTVASPGRPGTR